MLEFISDAQHRPSSPTKQHTEAIEILPSSPTSVTSPYSSEIRSDAASLASSTKMPRYASTTAPFSTRPSSASSSASRSEGPFTGRAGQQRPLASLGEPNRRDVHSRTGSDASSIRTTTTNDAGLGTDGSKVNPPSRDLTRGSSASNIRSTYPALVDAQEIYTKDLLAKKIREFFPPAISGRKRLPSPCNAT